MTEPMRRLIVLLDGTWNEDEDDGGDRDTNIVRLRDIITDGIKGDDKSIPLTIEEVIEHDASAIESTTRRWGAFDYIFFYERGVGTGPGLDRLTGGALGWGLGRNIRRAYKFLSQYYCAGSEIFIFGFSRGAYTARSLVGYLGSAGLLRAECCTPELEQQAWAYYRTSPNDRLPGILKELDKHTHPRREVRVACLGLFDAVGALGIPSSVFGRFNRQRYGFHDVELTPIVRLNLHALAIDEKRRPFEPSIWKRSRFKFNNSITEQVWFPGVHADVGGGYISRTKRYSGDVRPLDDLSLDWMLKRLKRYYPDFAPSEISFAEIRGATGEFGAEHESRTLRYKLSRPAIRTIGNLELEPMGREVVVGYRGSQTAFAESIHIAALDRLGRSVPVARSSNAGDWLISALEWLERRIPSLRLSRFLKPADPPYREKLYMPRNLIANFPDLYDIYCNGEDRSFAGGDPVTVVSWSGAVANPKESSDATEEVKRALNEAWQRLELHGHPLTRLQRKANGSLSDRCLLASDGFHFGLHPSRFDLGPM